ncbi:hypothetical protein AB0G04_18900 [Actinoplanes sp. NPDC023801]
MSFSVARATLVVAFLLLAGAVVLLASGAGEVTAASASTNGLIWG